MTSLLPFLILLTALGLAGLSGATGWRARDTRDTRWSLHSDGTGSPAWFHPQPPLQL